MLERFKRLLDYLICFAFGHSFSVVESEDGNFRACKRCRDLKFITLPDYVQKVLR